MQELQDLLTSFTSTVGEHLAATDVFNWPEEEWTTAPEEGVEEDAELARVLQEREELDEEDADDSVQRVPMTLKEEDN